MTAAELKLWAEFHAHKPISDELSRVALSSDRAVRRIEAERMLAWIREAEEQNRPNLLLTVEVYMTFNNWFRPEGVPPREETV